MYTRFQEHLESIKKVIDPLSSRFVFVNIPAQTLTIIDNGEISKTYIISTSRFGVGSREGSNMTPTGIHRIAQKIGTNAPNGRIFKSREDTGIDWHDGLTEDNIILTRILRLEGLEPGINKGPGIDSYERFIYIHGTNREDLIGSPMSHGCVCMRNADVTDLFDKVEEGTIVIIDNQQQNV